MRDVKYFAHATIKALSSNYPSICKVYDGAFAKAAARIENGQEVYYLGVKNTNVISEDILVQLEEAGFLRHTLDKMAHMGRAVDLELINPLTTKHMTGSSSGTALNLLYGINDIGIGTDGGGSVLCPALSLQLYGFISTIRKLPETWMKKSTDGIDFIPALGFLSRELSLLKKAAAAVFSPVEAYKAVIRIGIPKPAAIYNAHGEDINGIIKEALCGAEGIEVTELDFPDVYGERNGLIQFLTDRLKEYDVIISFEGPVDFYGIGDTIFGHGDPYTKAIQRRSGKGLTRAVNMASATALTIPSCNIASGFVLISNSSREGINQLFTAGEKLPVFAYSDVISRYFVQ